MTDSTQAPSDSSQPEDAGQGPFLDAAGRRQLELLAHRLRFDDGLQLLVGDFGSGRSTLLRQLAVLDPDGTLYVELNGGDSPYPVHGTRALLQALGQSCPDEADEAQRALTQQLQARSERGRHTVLAIDDADQLSVQQLEAWLQWWQDTQNDSAGGLPLLLVGGEQLVPYSIDLLGQEQPAPAITQLRPLDLGRARAYLEHMLGDELQGGLLPFSNSELDELQRQSGGLPGPLLDAAEQALLQAQTGSAPFWQPWRERLAPLSQRLPAWSRDRRVQLGVALIAVALLLFALEPDSPEPLGPVVKPLPIQLPPASTEPAAAPQQPAPEPIVAIAPQAPPALTSPPAVPPPQPPAEAPQAQSPQPAGEAETTPESAAQREPPRQPSLPPAPAPATIQLLSELAPPLGLGAPKTPQTPGRAAAPEPQPASAQSATAEAESAVRATPAKPAQATPADSDRDWLLLQPAERYTLQLLATAQRDALDTFAKRHQLTGELHQFSMLRNGQRLHVLVLGSFPNRAEASAELARLPAEVRRQKPWIRSLGSVQQTIREQGR